MKRRNFLKGAAGVAAAAGVGAGVRLDSLYARPSSPLALLAQLDAQDNDKILVIIQLFGGNDGLNTVIPALDDDYYAIRPAISIPKDRCWNGIGDIFLHPALSIGDKGGIAHMLEVGTLAIVEGVGYDRPNLSHFRSTDIWLSGINNSDPNVSLNTGWLGRYLEKRYPDFPNSLPNDPLAINFGGFSLALTSEKGRMGIEVDNPGLQSGGAMGGADVLDDQATGTHYSIEYDFIADIANRSNVYAQRVKDAYAAGKPKLKANYGTDGFSQQMASVAALIAGGLDTKVYIVSMGGFDTHVSQQTGDAMAGAHPALLARLGNAVSQFQYDLGQLSNVGIHAADRVIGMTVSEFGRRPHENGSLGTDHGAASVQFVFGTQVNSGVYGVTPDLKNLDSNGDLPWQIDYRNIYTSILTSWFELSLDEARVVLQDDSLTGINIIKSQPSAVRAGTALPVQVNVYPNPARERTSIDITLPEAATVSLELVSTSGAASQKLLSRTLAAGTHTIPLALDLPNGAYLLSLRAGAQRITRIVHVLR